MTSRAAPRECPCPRPGWQRVSACGDEGTSAQAQLSRPNEPRALLLWESVPALMRARRQQTSPFVLVSTEASLSSSKMRRSPVLCLTPDGTPGVTALTMAVGSPLPGSRFSSVE